MRLFLTLGEAGDVALEEEGWRGRSRRVYGDGDTEGKCDIRDLPWPRTTRMGLLEDILGREEVAIAVMVWDHRYMYPRIGAEYIDGF